MIQAPSGSGKTVFACAWIAELQVPTLVVVHKDFLMSQWRERIEEYLPGAKIGIVQQDECNFAGKHIVLAMVHSLSQRKYPEALYRWPGHVVIDEVHRMGARTWAPVAPKFPVRFRTGLSATPRRKDGAENAFFYHIGPVIFKSREQRLKAKVRRVHSTFKIVKTPSFNPALAPESLLLRFLCANVPRNKKIVDLMIEAVKARRKLLVLSKRLKHLNLLDQMLKHAWPPEAGPLPTVGYYVGGMKEEARDKSATAQVIFATSQFAAEGLDIPALDTLFLVCPMGDVEQACGRVLRSYDGKKDPIVVDIRDDFVPMFKALGSARDRLYDRIC